MDASFFLSLSLLSCPIVCVSGIVVIRSFCLVHSFVHWFVFYLFDHWKNTQFNSIHCHTHTVLMITTNIDLVLFNSIPILEIEMTQWWWWWWWIVFLFVSLIGKMKLFFSTLFFAPKYIWKSNKGNKWKKLIKLWLWNLAHVCRHGHWSFSFSHFIHPFIHFIHWQLVKCLPEELIIIIDDDDKQQQQQQQHTDIQVVLLSNIIKTIIIHCFSKNKTKQKKKIKLSEIFAWSFWHHPRKKIEIELKTDRKTFQDHYNWVASHKKNYDGTREAATLTS